MFDTSKVTINTIAYADDLAALSNKLNTLQTQINKIDKFCKWSEMDVGVRKCAITGCPNKSKKKPIAFKTTLQNANINYRGQSLPILTQNEAYVYLRIHVVPTLKWKIQTHITTTKLTKQCKDLTQCLASMTQKIKMIDNYPTWSSI